MTWWSKGWTVDALTAYLREMAKIHAAGEATDETSYYPALSNLLNAVGGTLTPTVHCVVTPKNRGAGVPDGGFFIKQEAVVEADTSAMVTRSPERGAMEVKGLKQNVVDIAASKQVARYLERYGQVLVTNYREFLPVRLDSSGKSIEGELFTLAATEAGFWVLTEAGVGTDAKAFEEFLARVLLADAPLSNPADLAWFLAAYARTARQRIDAAGSLATLTSLRSALEDALGLRFEGDRGEDFFRSALIQTLFYGVFAAWVVWHAQQPEDSEERFSWKQAQWTLNVPMVRVLFQQLATPTNLPAGLDETLYWTEDALSRVDRKLFFERFEAQDAVQYFYEPFLQAYDPDLRKELGVWYTPPEIVRYIVARVHEALQRDLGVKLGLADEQVHVLDPCTGTGSFLVESIRTIAKVLDEEHDDALVAQQAKKAALSRVHGFELLPAPFVVAHLQLGLLLDQLGAPLTQGSNERASVYLTNALTGWKAEDHPHLPFPEFEEERDAAEEVKRSDPILVVLGNPPYNGFAGVSGEEEGGLVQPYKDGLSATPWEITKNKLDDLYVRFFRIAERRIAEHTGRGIVCFISNFGWLGDPSTVVMRRRLVSEFDRIYIDNLNGDSRETGKKTPDGKPDPSVFSTRLNVSGIQVGTAISLLVRTRPHGPGDAVTLYREFWGGTKLDELTDSLGQLQEAPHYETLVPAEENWFRLRRWSPRQGYENWPSVTDLAAERPALGLNENRDGGLIDIDQEAVASRLEHFLDADVEYDDLDHAIVGELLQPWARYDAKTVRDTLLNESPYSGARIVPFQVKPFDVRWAYVEPTSKLWNESRAGYVKAADLGSDFLLVRRRAPRALDGAAFLFSPHLIDQHVLHKDAYTIPILVPVEIDEEATSRLFSFGHESPTGLTWRPNLSQFALDYLANLGLHDAGTSIASARTLWMHVLAIGYSPLYLDENADAIRNAWPRVPLPATREALEQSRRLGERLATLLDIRTAVPQIDLKPSALNKTVGAISRTDGATPAPADLAITAGWGVGQTRTLPSGAITHAVMPGSGLLVQRPRAQEDAPLLSEEQRALLGEEVIDVFLNDHTYWSSVPEAAWDFKIGGFQVLRKWLSYRELTLLGRVLSLNEVREFASIARRLTEIALLGPELDANYRASTGAGDQEALWDS